MATKTVSFDLGEYAMWNETAARKLCAAGTCHIGGRDCRYCKPDEWIQVAWIVAYENLRKYEEPGIALKTLIQEVNALRSDFIGKPESRDRQWAILHDWEALRARLLQDREYRYFTYNVTTAD